MLFVNVEDIYILLTDVGSQQTEFLRPWLFQLRRELNANIHADWVLLSLLTLFPMLIMSWFDWVFWVRVVSKLKMTTFHQLESDSRGRFILLCLS